MKENIFETRFADCTKNKGPSNSSSKCKNREFSTALSNSGGLIRISHIMWVDFCAIVCRRLIRGIESNALRESTRRFLVVSIFVKVPPQILRRRRSHFRAPFEFQQANRRIRIDRNTVAQHRGRFLGSFRTRPKFTGTTKRNGLRRVCYVPFERADPVFSPTVHTKAELKRTQQKENSSHTKSVDSAK